MDEFWGMGPGSPYYISDEDDDFDMDRAVAALDRMIKEGRQPFEMKEKSAA